MSFFNREKGIKARMGYLNIIGVIAFQSPEPHEFDFSFRRILEQRARSFGIALSLGTNLLYGELGSSPPIRLSLALHLSTS